ncbi:Olah [Symbiodinium natans]|uniref:Olah protein n=1 Tax=Symbiodinium natans TaxID=878477 RepID=A0A812J8G0_9DINO|nr:Olah [Symbiodinium natans]
MFHAQAGARCCDARCTLRTLGSASERVPSQAALTRLLPLRLRWLREGPLQLTAEQLRRALAVKPLVYLKEPQASYERALQVAPEQWRSPQAFKALLLREPQVLDLTHNCLLTDPADRVKDEWGEAVHCDGKCTHCWRTATPKLMGQVLDGVEV